MKKVFNVKHINYYGYEHEKVYQRFGGDLKYMGDLVLKDQPYPVALYKAASPDYSKGHKDFMTLVTQQGKSYVGGMTKEEVKKHAVVKAVRCMECDTVLYSVHRHDYHTCDCPNETMVDGGRAYLRYGGKSLDLIEVGTYNMYTNYFRKGKKK